MDSFNVMEAKRFEWAKEAFPEATAESSLNKLAKELEEVRTALKDGSSLREVAEEYADCLMCVFDSARRAGLSPLMLQYAFQEKMKKNMARKWTKNPDNTYSHVK